tara:strand:- start:424 stop:723 length:300 start_codon:yes stop_codon:yes gene_type:complete
MFKRNTRVRLTKVSHHSDEVYTNEQANIHQDGNRQFGVPKGYDLEGEILIDFAIGESMQVLRFKRNGVEMLGHFTSSEVIDITETQIMTVSSVYNITIL